MSLKFPWQACGIAIGLMACTSSPAQTPAPVGSFPPSGGITSTIAQTNSARATRKDGLKYLEEELSKSLQFFSGKPSLNGVLAPPTIQAPPPQTLIAVRPKQGSDKDEGWASLGKEDGFGSEKTSDLLELPGRDRSEPRRNSIEDLYRRLDRDRQDAMKTGPNPSDPLRSRSMRDKTDRFDSMDDDTLTGSSREAEQGLRKLMGERRSDRLFNPGGEKEGGFGLFQTKDTGLSRADLEAHQNYLERYRQLLAGPSAAPSLQNQLQTLSGAQPAQSPVPSGRLDAFGPSLKSDSSSSAASSVGSILNPATMPDMNGKALNRWNPLYEVPKIEPAKSAGPKPVPFAEAPRRRF